MSYQLETLSPVAVCEGDVNAVTLKARPKSLEGQHIGLYWNGKHGGEVALKRAAQALEARFAGCTVTFFPGSRPISAATMEKLKKSECSVFLGSTAD